MVSSKLNGKKMTTKKKIIKNLAPEEYEHRFDRKALNAIQKTTGQALIVRQFIKHGVERAWTIQCTGSHIKVSEFNYPEINDILLKVCRILNLSEIPDLYMRWDYEINGGTIGVEKPIIILTSGAVDLLSTMELFFLIGHEVGHIKSRHMLYHMIAGFIPYMAETLGKPTLGIGELLTLPIKYAFLFWERMSEFTADRTGLLACQDIHAATTMFSKMAGVPQKYHSRIKSEHFIQQAKDFEGLDFEKLNKYFKVYAIMDSTHPWTVMRASELIKWIDSGGYDDVLQRKTLIPGQTTDTKNGTTCCTECHFRLSGNGSFCPNCGAKLQPSQVDESDI